MCRTHLNLIVNHMKNILLTTLSVFFINTFLFSQTALNKTVPESNVEHIAVYGNQGETYFSTSSDYFMYQCGDFNPTNLGASVNDIDVTGLPQVVRNDTNCVKYASASYYYGINNTVTDGSNTHDMYTTVNALASDGTNIYALASSGNEFNIFQINGGSSTPLGTNFGNLMQLDSYSDLDYFELGGTSYIAITYTDNSERLGLYNMSDNSFYLTEEQGPTALVGVTSVTVTNSGVFFSKGNEIYQITNIGSHTNPQYKTVTTSLVYTIDVGQTINEFSFNLNETIIGAAATDGVYSECTSTAGIDEQEVAFEGSTLYPNPNRGKFIIESVNVGSNIRIFDSRGVTVFKKNNLNEADMKLNLEISNGLYFVKIQSDKGTETIRLIINE